MQVPLSPVPGKASLHVCVSGQGLDDGDGEGVGGGGGSVGLVDGGGDGVGVIGQHAHLYSLFPLFPLRSWQRSPNLQLSGGGTPGFIFVHFQSSPNSEHPMSFSIHSLQQAQSTVDVSQICSLHSLGL